jgi:hypothetical protein
MKDQNNFGAKLSKLSKASYIPASQAIDAFPSNNLEKVQSQFISRQSVVQRQILKKSVKRGSS